MKTTEKPDQSKTVRPASGAPSLPYIASRVLNRPLLLHPDKAQIVLEVIQGRIGLDQIVTTPSASASPEANGFIGSYRRKGGKRALTRVKDGTSILPIVGSLVNRGAWIGASSGLVSYEGLAAQMREAASDPEVSAILLDIDSPGGEATGMFGLARLIREVNQTKPVLAMVNDVAASAAYGIASSAREIIVSPTSMVGSVGVVLTHLDRSGELEKKGVKATLIHAGAHKVDGNSLGPLSEDVRADLQAEVMKFYDQFVGLVAEGRTGRMTEAQVRATEARVYFGADAIDIGLADRVASLDEVLAEFSTTTALGATSKRGIAMSNPTTTAPQAESTGFTQADLDAARAEGHRAGFAEETARIKGILTLPAAQSRWDQAKSLAFDTTISPDSAKAILAATPVQQVPSSLSPSIEERADMEEEFGCDLTSMRSKGERIADGWKKAVAQANAKMIGGSTLRPDRDHRNEEAVASDFASRIPSVRHEKPRMT